MWPLQIRSFPDIFLIVVFLTTKKTFQSYFKIACRRKSTTKFVKLLFSHQTKKILMSFQVKYRNSHIVVICHNTFIHCWLTKFSNSSGKNPILNPKYHLGKVFFLICLNSSFTLSCVTEADFKQSSHMDLIWPCASSLFQ